ncbi:tRNA (adenosine(37)-N6)-threonylcarbamoyltransferase complex ATPase subunit type 1 TsaE [Ideonella sp.]|uniref:tRNA (adenosine(37)-N6)-threonylcarbamoyltransferase complex ATPase subunit type 1 TsaE n=1 Tax=Ideonella sp. TaxID=1929293 RepID=UPI002B4888E9|nr:tRNA (adenosine(37)-N6)-threonylcarbamoyltransferase complex ATPase subunit type 1 TsaE [Ideonella sp.]HJV69074.1 tRNA (adenosine(37)-N6)-threonylcarbamoyltransferase complex ATPase subunit type 1 TsaE [Ideonella sp.]
MTTHPPILETRSLHWPDEAACARFAAALADAIASQRSLQDAKLELDGPLGAGKTTFVRHLLRALGATGRIKSPTYAVVEPYALTARDGSPLPASHFDFYRFDDPREWDDAGFREIYAEPGLKIAEWAAKAAPQLPPPDLKLAIEPQADDSRRVRAEACSATGRQLLAAADAAA